MNGKTCIRTYIHVQHVRMYVCTYVCMYVWYASKKPVGTCAKNEEHDAWYSNSRGMGLLKRCFTRL